jgi:hypothetical protein
VTGGPRGELITAQGAHPPRLAHLGLPQCRSAGAEGPTPNGAQDVRRFGPGERFVFEPYTQDMYERTQTWIHERGIFAAEQARSGRYTEAVIRLEAAG